MKQRHESRINELETKLNETELNFSANSANVDNLFSGNATLAIVEEGGGTEVEIGGSVLDDGGHDPYAAAAMLGFRNSKFSQLRLQYNYEEVREDEQDNQIILQYIMNVRAHDAHPF